MPPDDELEELVELLVELFVELLVDSLVEPLVEPLVELPSGVKISHALSKPKQSEAKRIIASNFFIVRSFHNFMNIYFYFTSF